MSGGGSTVKRSWSGRLALRRMYQTPCAARTGRVGSFLG